MAGVAGRYVFGVTVPDFALSPGLDAAPLAAAVEGLAVGRLQAVVSPVAAAEFGGTGPSDPAWLLPRVVAHDRVLTAVAATGPVVPFRFGVVHRSRAATVRALRAASDVLGAALAGVAAGAEWTVAISPAPDPPAAVPPPGGGRGRAYLVARGAVLAQRERSEEVAAGVRRRCAARGIPAVALPPRHDGARRVACLIPRTAERAVVAELERLAAEDSGVRVAVTGPLPPYHFVAPEPA